jgi:hypothetical protein
MPMHLWFEGAGLGLLVLYGWLLRRWCRQLSAQVALLTLAVRELQDQLAAATAPPPP